MANTTTSGLAPAPDQQTQRYFDQHTAPCGEHAFRQAIRQNAFPAWRVGKRLLARAADVITWIESDAHRIAPMKPANDLAEEEIDAVLAAGGVSRRAGS